ncbi:hypothetical protein AC249_AIPGENE12258 [Exaiptasia diaphana]|nr:hypothetical protein AC249_AIPGENE12258 [Exaiptasia diaphana]
MESGKISDSSITVSSYSSFLCDPIACHPNKGRINSDAAWATKISKVGENLQVVFGINTTMTGIGTQDIL